MAAIIFDFDGTLADSFDYVSEFLARQAGRWPLSPEQKQELRGLSVAGMVRKLGYHWWDAPELFFKGRWRMRHAIKHLHPFEGMPDIIRKLHAEGHELFILSTNSVGNIHRFLHHHKLHTYFLEIYGGVGMFGKGPALKRLLREQNIALTDAAYVGDEMGDVLSARAIGLPVIAVTWGFALRSNLVAEKAIGLAHTPDELMSLLEEL